jgi:hypothetical protein
MKLRLATLTLAIIVAACGAKPGTAPGQTPPEATAAPVADATQKPVPAAPTDSGEFCRRYRDYVAWAVSFPSDTDMTQPLAHEIATRFDDMWPYAPSEVRKDVSLMWAIYSTFAGIDKPMNIPATGQVAGIDKLPEALMAMHAYCGIPWPGA